MDPARVLPVTAYHSAMGISGSRHSMFAADVDESMRTAPGGGLQCVPTPILHRWPSACCCWAEWVSNTVTVCCVCAICHGCPHLV